MSKEKTDEERLFAKKYINHELNKRHREDYKGTLFQEILKLGYFNFLRTRLGMLDHSQRQEILNAKSLNNESILHYAVSINCPVEIISLLVTKENIHYISDHGDSVLHMAVGHTKTDVIEFLLSNGAKDNSVDFMRRTALHEAIRNKMINIVKLLLNKENLIKKDCQGLTPLHSVVYIKDIHLLEFLFEKYISLDIDPNKLLDEDNNTILDCAAKVNFVEGINYFCQNGMDVNRRGHGEQTSIYSAIEKHNIEAVQAFISLGANLDNQDCQGRTPLMYATSPQVFIFDRTKSKSLNIIKILFEAGANPAIPNKHGEYLSENLDPKSEWTDDYAEVVEPILERLKLELTPACTK